MFSRMSLRGVLILCVCLLTVPMQAMDVDSGMDAIGLAQALSSSQPSAISSQVSGFLASVSQGENRGHSPGRRPVDEPRDASRHQQGAPGGQQHTTASSQVSVDGWARLRGIDLSKVPETREALLKLHANGIKTCVFLRLSSPDWKRKYLPDDLRESYEHGRKLGAAFGDVVDAWEVDNEPDLGFVPESAERYTAFLKAMYLGIKAGAAEAKEQSGKSKAQGAQPFAPRPSPNATNGSLVIMGSLGLPPGPWLERFAANDGFVYTDGFNYHYYGYAEDFTGVYQQHEEAVNQLSVERYRLSGIPTNNPQPITNNLSQKNLPVFLTEVGYGMLGKEARDTKEGRLRQWRWFKSVGEQANTLRIEAPMAFYLPPYLEYDTSEYGLTVPPGGAVKLSDEGYPLLAKSGESWTAGGIKYTAEDFAEVGRVVPNAPSDADPGGLRIIRPTPENWMNRIGTDIGGNQATPALAQWLAIRKGKLSVQSYRLSGSAPNNPQPITDNHDGSRAWSVSVPRPSPVVIDFLPGEGLSHVKRYNGLFVTSKNPEVGRVAPNAPSKPPSVATPPSAVRPQPSEQPRSEELILQVRTQNGNLYEVYPTRQAKPEWQRYMEPGDNFTMAFYGRAALPWRFKDNQPASLVIVMYPKHLPAVYEFRRPQLLKLSAVSSQLSASFRYGAGTIVLYNFSDKPATGRLEIPPALSPLPLPLDPNASTVTTALTLAPGERREIPVSIKVPWDRYERIPTEIRFMAEPTPASPIPAPSLHRTDLLPDLANRPTTLVADLLARSTDDRRPTADGGQQPNNQEPSTDNRSRIATRPRASEEGLMAEQRAESKEPSAPVDSSGSLSPSPHALTAFVQSGATVERTTDGFTIIITARQPGKQQRIEVELPWPEGVPFNEDEFLSVEFRIR
jgi:hypothetical protein